jgi:hypothetical protein
MCAMGKSDLRRYDAIFTKLAVDASADHRWQVDGRSGASLLIDELSASDGVKGSRCLDSPL